MKLLIGSTGYVGSALCEHQKFDFLANSRNMHNFKDQRYEELICAGLPAQKWIANSNPAADFLNMSKLATDIQSIDAAHATLISTVDVFESNANKTELDPPDLFGDGAYGVNRAWFEILFRSQFKNNLIVRLPGLFSRNLRKNLIFDLMNNREEQFMKVNPKSTFQFFNLELLSEVIDTAKSEGISTLNISSEPVEAREVAELFGHSLTNESIREVHYDMRSQHDKLFGGNHGYLYSKAHILESISRLKSLGQLN